ncbi:MAG: alpha-amylase family protein [Leptolyngbya sp. SIO1E4]|nr:alpha-amylase family protein [Leptolyngbya sp. SIO1E4]
MNKHFPDGYYPSGYLLKSASYRSWLTGLGVLASLGGLLAAALQSPSSDLPLELTSLDTADRSVSVHLFEWTWSDIAQECEAFLGPQGFEAVQISPPQEHVVVPESGFPWWQRYQPVSYQLVSRSGDRAQLKDMVQRCRQAGVAVYADAVINHMAAIDTAAGSAGTQFRRYHYPGLYNPEDFNACRSSAIDYQDAEQVTQCELVSLPDLNTASTQVQTTLVGYLADLADLGIEGFRIDAAKHIRSHELGAILNQVRDRIEPDPYIYQEVIDPGTEAIKKHDYYSLGDVVEFEYGRHLGEAFLNVGDRTLANLQTLDADGGLTPSDQAVIFIDNHDKQRGHGGGGNYLTYKDGPLHTLAKVFMLAHPYGKPRIMSSYRFTHSDQGPPADVSGRTQTVYAPDFLGCQGAWVCEHRQPEVAAMVRFRAATQSVPRVTDWWSNGSNQIAFGRGDLGFVVINREETPLSHTFQTQLPPGRYCEVLHASTNPAHCDALITVDEQGQFQATVGAMDAIAIHQGDRGHRN